MIELEKRWEVIDSLVPFDKAKEVINIEQTYFSFNPDVRVRKYEVINGNTDYFHTTKHFLDNNEREEIEVNISVEQYNRIKNNYDKIPVLKTRYVIPLNKENLYAEVDKFLDEDKTIVEVEFQNQEQINNFIKPIWFGEEILPKKQFSLNAQIFAKLNGISYQEDNVFNELYN